MELESKATTPESGKEKKTRRRLRLSCVECTKRRQKCDRKYPCSLCVSRGVSHLCRWESIPVARPTPARPPNTLDSSEQTIQQLLSRIAILESALEGNNTREVSTKHELSQDPIALPSPPSSVKHASGSNTSAKASPAPGSSSQPSPPAESEITDQDQATEHDAPEQLEPAAYAQASALAYLSVGHHGEYIGRGSIICALHSVNATSTPRFLYAKSTESTSPYYQPKPGIMSTTLVDKVENLIREIPPLDIANLLLSNFFHSSNWRYGIPEEWFRTACTEMWNVLKHPGPHSSQINPNWLCLFFAVLADAPKLPEDARPNSNIEIDGDHYFSCAMSARRIGEDEYLNKPSISLMVTAADGTVLSCFAVSMLSSYLSQRGRVSEAWKLVGSAVRSAEAVGMHRDPEWRAWQVMSNDEVVLRRRGWWALYVRDKLYSFLLGRPQMIREGTFDVAATASTGKSSKRNLKIFNLGHSLFIELCVIIGDVHETCFSVRRPEISVFLDMDKRLEKWEKDLPPEYQLTRSDGVVTDLSPAELLVLNHQRYTFHTWYLMCRITLHIAALVGTKSAQPLQAGVTESSRSVILTSMKLIIFQCDTHDAAVQYKADKFGQEPPFPGNIWYFEGCFSLFEATVALITTLARFPWKEKTLEANRLIDRAIGVLTDVAGQGQERQLEIARMGSEVLRSLRQDDMWIETLPTPDRTVPKLSVPRIGAQPDNAGYDWFASVTYSGLFKTPLDQPEDMASIL